MNTLNLVNIKNKTMLLLSSSHRGAVVVLLQGRAHDYRGAGAQSQERAVCACAQHAPNFFSGLNNTICRLINVKFIHKVQES